MFSCAFHYGPVWLQLRERSGDGDSWEVPRFPHLRTVPTTVYAHNICASSDAHSPSREYIRDLKQTRRRRKQERHLKMCLRVFAIIFQLFKLIMLEKCVLTILELNWNQRLGQKTTKLNICHPMLTSSTQLQNRSFHVVERTRTSSKCQKMKNARAKRAKLLFFIVKYANLWGFCCRRRRGCLSSLMTFGNVSYWRCNWSPVFSSSGTEESRGQHDGPQK